MSVKRNFKIVSGLILVGLLTSFSGCTQVNTGHRGVKTRFGRVVSESLPEGLYFYNPITTKIASVDTRLRAYSVRTEAYTKDMQVAVVILTINFNVQREKAHLLFAEIGRYYEEIAIQPRIVGALKNIFGTMEADQIISNRANVELSIKELLNHELSNIHIDVQSVMLSDIEYSKEFDKANEDKQVAVQHAAAARNRTVQIQEEAKQVIIKAEAEAKAMQIKTEALSKNQGLVAYEAVQKWDGKLPNVMSGDAPLPFFEVGKIK